VIPVLVWPARGPVARWPKVQCRLRGRRQTFATPPELVDLRIIVRFRAGTQAGPGGQHFAQVSRHEPIAGDGGAMRPLPAQIISQLATPFGAASREDGLVFSLGPSYRRGRASSVTGATWSGPMRRISRKD